MSSPEGAYMLCLEVHDETIAKTIRQAVLDLLGVPFQFALHTCNNGGSIIPGSDVHIPTSKIDEILSGIADILADHGLCAERQGNEHRLTIKALAKPSDDRPLTNGQVISKGGGDDRYDHVGDAHLDRNLYKVSQTVRSSRARNTPRRYRFGRGLNSR